MPPKRTRQESVGPETASKRTRYAVSLNHAPFLKSGSTNDISSVNEREQQEVWEGAMQYVNPLHFLSRIGLNLLQGSVCPLSTVG